MASRLAGWVLLACGCQDAGPFVIPAEEGAASVLLSFRGASGPTAFALDLWTEGQPAVEIDLAEAPEVFAHYYACPLDGLRVPKGPIAIGDREDQRLLPEPERILRTIARGDDYGPWQEVEDTNSVSRLRLALGLVDHCPELETRTFEVPGGLADRPLDRGNLQFAAAIDPDRALVVFQNGEQFVVTPEEVRLVNAPSADVRSLDAITSSAGVMLHLLADGRLARGDPDEGYVVSGSSLAESLGTFGALVAHESLGLHALGSRGKLFRRERSIWREVFTTTTEDARVDLLRVGPRELLAVGLERSRILRVRDGVATSVVYDTVATDSTAHVAVWSEPLGAVFGGSIGGFFDNTTGALIVDRGTHFETLASMKVGRIYSLAAYREGVLFGGDDGQFARFDAEHGACAPLQLERPVGDVAAIVRLGRRVLVIQEGISPERRPKAHFVYARGCPMQFD